jgi:hypothetical protein
MSDTPELGRIAVLRTLSLWHRALRLAILLAPGVVLAAIAIDAGQVSPPVAIGLMLLAAISALVPDGNMGVLTVLLLAWYWAATIDRPTSGATLLAALGILVFHTALAASTVAPPAAVWSRSMQRRWARRTITVGVATTAAWLAARSLGSASIDGRAAVLSAALVGLAAAAVWIRHRGLARLPEGPR